MLYGIEICKVVDIKINGESYTAELGIFWRATLCVLCCHSMNHRRNKTEREQRQTNNSVTLREKKKQKDICVCVYMRSIYRLFLVLYIPLLLLLLDTRSFQTLSAAQLEREKGE
jgi:hypothetical protein